MPDYLGQTSIPFMPIFSSSAAAPVTAGSGSGGEEGSGGKSVAVEEEEVLQLEARCPERQALDDLFRTKVQFQHKHLISVEFCLHADCLPYKDWTDEVTLCMQCRCCPLLLCQHVGCVQPLHSRQAQQAPPTA